MRDGYLNPEDPLKYMLLLSDRGYRPLRLYPIPQPGDAEKAKLSRIKAGWPSDSPEGWDVLADLELKLRNVNKS